MESRPAAGGAIKPQLHMLRPDLEALPDPAPPDGCPIRPFRPGWERAWERIIDESFEAAPGTYSFEKTMRSDPSFRPERILFVCCGDEPVAVAAAYHWPHRMPDAGMLHYVGVLKAYRGRRLGFHVSLAALLRMRGEGFRRAWLSTDDFRLPAIKTYLDLGFQPLLIHENQRARWAAVFERLGRKDLLRPFAGILGGPVVAWPDGGGERR
ncbi:MAG: GNAT family N-acetyltransferase [Planctomycetota bacterium]|nr:GNAT family N-acetyltransferase [Planctomycetota bacterium]